MCCLPFNYWPEQRHEAKSTRVYDLKRLLFPHQLVVSCISYLYIYIHHMSYNRVEMSVHDTTYFRYPFALKVRAMLYAVHGPKLNMYEAMRKDT